jgi:hypothetical protein
MYEYIEIKMGTTCEEMGHSEGGMEEQGGKFRSCSLN